MDDEPERIIMLKADYIIKINDLLTRCHDLKLIALVFKILQKGALY